MKDNQKLVTVARFENGFEAEQAKIFLESEGIPAIVFGGDLVANMPTIDAIQIVLQVFEADRHRAQELLRDFTAADDDSWQEDQEDTEANDE